ncbi:MAG: hypothetical protein QOC74_4098 [Pseudonocardiales bacterium]|jgi:MFS family permease|nr:hypothetical protein [Pseudonocardiales bacterium]
MSTAKAETIRTDIPARLDRLPWSRFHWRIVIGLGTVWILDGLEVTVVGAVSSRMTEPGSGITLNAAGIGTAAAVYVAGACLGALFFGQLTDRLGRKRLFMITLALYLVATVLTAFAFAPWYFFLCRFLTGAGIGGEYSAINSAVDELIPRGQVDLAINGSFWAGSGIGSLAALLLLNETIFPTDLGWRLAFGLGFVIGLGILVVRWHVPESPRWLFLRGRIDEAERIVDEIECEVKAQTGAVLPPPSYEVSIRLRDTVRYRDLVKLAIQRYPNRARTKTLVPSGATRACPNSRPAPLPRNRGETPPCGGTPPGAISGRASRIDGGRQYAQYAAGSQHLGHGDREERGIRIGGDPARDRGPG